MCISSTHLSLQIKQWFSVEGEKHLAPLDSLTLSLGKIKDMRQTVDQFLAESTVQRFFIGTCLCTADERQHVFLTPFPLFRVCESLR